MALPETLDEGQVQISEIRRKKPIDKEINKSDFGYENSLEPRSYLEYLLNNIGKKNFHDLLPWSGSIPSEIGV